MASSVGGLIVGLIDAFNDDGCYRGSVFIFVWGFSEFMEGEFDPRQSLKPKPKGPEVYRGGPSISFNRSGQSG